MNVLTTLASVFMKNKKNFSKKVIFYKEKIVKVDEFLLFSFFYKIVIL